jgi:hypothetical protein
MGKRFARELALQILVPYAFDANNLRAFTEKVSEVEELVYSFARTQHSFDTYEADRQPLSQGRWQLELLKSKQVESAAYHEAGHMTAAIVQGMPIREKGLLVDLHGNGCANYFERPATDSGMTLHDMRERKFTIIALFSAHAAQLRYYPECLRNEWSNDLIKISTLSRQIHPADEAAEIAVRKELRVRANLLVDRYWLLIEELANVLLAKPYTLLSQEEFWEWGQGPTARHMSGHEVRQLFAKHSIPAKIVDDNVRDYDSTQDVPPYDSLA